MADVLLQVEGLGKKYARSLRRSIGYGMRDVVSEVIGQRVTSELREDEFWAVRDVSFELRRGECLAIMGGNGAGKSTLLKLVCGILSPDLGRIHRVGRLEKMIELGAGLAPKLTGRQNIALRSRLLGLTKKESADRLDEVVAFAELEEFIDTPVTFYSTGMKARLGFAATVVMSPDILVIDEVLAVGDLGFRMKCYERVDQMRRTSAVVLVSHGMNHVSRMSTISLVLQKGRPVHYGSTQAGIALYQELSGGHSKLNVSSHHPERVSFTLLCNGKQLHKETNVQYGDRLTILGVHTFPGDLDLSIVLHESNGPTVADWQSMRAGFRATCGKNFRLEIGAAELCPGYYHWNIVGLSSDGTQQFLSAPLRFKMEGLHLGGTRLQPRGTWAIDSLEESATDA